MNNREILWREYHAVSRAIYERAGRLRVLGRSKVEQEEMQRQQEADRQRHASIAGELDRAKEVA